jgi:hypothetical protein
MSKGLDRRSFLKRSVATSAGAALGLSFEEKALLARAEAQSAQPASSSSGKSLPTGKIGDLEISRLICGGNLISGNAHSRDLIYVSPLLKQYFTDDKVLETFQIAEENGVNTAILRLDSHVLRIIDKHWNERGGKLQWIAQIKPSEENIKRDIRRAVDNGATGAYLQGGVADSFTRSGRIDLIGMAVEYMKEHGVIAGIGAHMLDVVIASEEAGLNPDFYMKTLNSKSYWSAGPIPRHDSVWAETPKETIEFMKTVKKPWIAFKVLGAGAIHPKPGFSYAFNNGADFICVGMFDFQVRMDADLVRDTFAKGVDRPRPWMA